MSSRTIAAVAAVAALAVLIGGGAYISKLRGDVAAARWQLAGAQQELQKSKVAIDHEQKLAADTAAARDKYKADAEAAAAKVASLSNDLDQSRKQLAAAQSRVTASRHTVAQTKRISGYWRTLYDATAKQTNTPEKTVAENKTEPEKTAKN